MLGDSKKWARFSIWYSVLYLRSSDRNMLIFMYFYILRISQAPKESLIRCDIGTYYVNGFLFYYCSYTEHYIRIFHHNGLNWKQIQPMWVQLRLIYHQKWIIILSLLIVFDLTLEYNPFYGTLSCLQSWSLSTQASASYRIRLRCDFLLQWPGRLEATGNGKPEIFARCLQKKCYTWNFANGTSYGKKF